MGQALQRKDYVIVFTASWETLEDTLLFFHNEVKEESLSMPWFRKELTGAIGVHAAALSENLTFRQCFEIQGDTLCERAVREPFLPAVVHFLHFGSDQEPDEHRSLSERFASSRIPAINVYNDAVVNCGSKLRMNELLERRGIPTPPARLISRFNEDKQQALEGIREEFHSDNLFLQPDRGTEGEGCLYLGDGLDAAVASLSITRQDTVVRKKVGNVLYDEQNLVVRLNVTFDGHAFEAESGYCLVGGTVVCAERGAKKEDLHRVFQRIGLGVHDIRKVQSTAKDAVRAVCEGSTPPGVVGVDLVLEERALVTPYVIDINPRPVVVGSRRIGGERIGLGEHYWRGVGKLVKT